MASTMANVRENLTKSEIVNDFVKKSYTLKKSRIDPLDFFETLIVTVDKASHALPKSKLSFLVAKSLDENFYTTLDMVALQRLVQSFFVHVNKYKASLFGCELETLPSFVRINCLRRFVKLMKEA